MQQWAMLWCMVLVACVAVARVRAGTCTIDASAKQQSIDGFGFSSAWCGTLSAARNKALYDTLGMSILRIRIDENSYWNDETNNAKAAHSRGVTVLGSPWSAPPSMTSDGKGAGANHNLRTDKYADYAAYLQKAANQIGLDIVSIQNEPDYNAWMNWTPEQVITFIRNNAQVITTPLMAAESFNFNDQYYDGILNDATLVDRIKYVGGHLYGDGQRVHQNAINHGKRVWMTEHYFDGMDSASTSVQIAQEVSDSMNNQMNAYLWWWVYLPDNNANLVDNDGHIHKNGYTLGQFAKYIRPGAVRISSTYHPTSGVSVTAYTSTQYPLVIVAVNANNGAVQQSFALVQLGGVQKLSVFGTTAADNFATMADVAVSNGTFSLSLPAQSTVTLYATSTGPDPCASVNCGAHGSCLNGACTCKDGYTGANCDVAPSPSDPCLSVNCGAHGSCSNGVCTCKDGYTGATCNIAPPPDPCAAVNCGAHGSCSNGACTCKDGYTGATCNVPPTSASCFATAADVGSNAYWFAFNVQAAAGHSIQSVAVVKGTATTALSGPANWGASSPSVFTGNPSASTALPFVLKVTDTAGAVSNLVVDAFAASYSTCQ